jgi:hypothetical protein
VLVGLRPPSQWPRSHSPGDDPRTPAAATPQNPDATAATAKGPPYAPATPQDPHTQAQHCELRNGALRGVSGPSGRRTVRFLLLPARRANVRRTRGEHALDRAIGDAAPSLEVAITLGTSADLEVDGGYLSSGGHIVFLPPGTAPTFQDCLSALGPASSQGEPLTAIIPGPQADLCSSGSGGDIAYMHVTRSDQSGLTMNITIWEYLP